MKKMIKRISFITNSNPYRMTVRDINDITPFPKIHVSTQEYEVLPSDHDRAVRFMTYFGLNDQIWVENTDVEGIVKITFIIPQNIIRDDLREQSFLFNQIM
ncbi:MAG: hypothetical protein UZ19_OD1000913 [Parcubacteria bacterium OLB19]|nr:MAG: hypothetical protein UZ19_OD1000913 [Parcubacteria bacterium OLB19]